MKLSTLRISLVTKANNILLVLFFADNQRILAKPKYDLKRALYIYIYTNIMYYIYYNYILRNRSCRKNNFNMFSVRRRFITFKGIEYIIERILKT